MLGTLRLRMWLYEVIGPSGTETPSLSTAHSK
jgi:hypothetical protein